MKANPGKPFFPSMYHLPLLSCQETSYRKWISWLLLEVAQFLFQFWGWMHDQECAWQGLSPNLDVGDHSSCCLSHTALQAPLLYLFFASSSFLTDIHSFPTLLQLTSAFPSYLFSHESSLWTEHQAQQIEKGRDYQAHWPQPLPSGLLLQHTTSCVCGQMFGAPALC